MQLSRDQGVDLVAVLNGKANEIDAEADLKFVIAYDARRADLVAVGKAKTQRDACSCQRGNEAVDEDPLRSKVEDPAITAISVYFTTGAQ